MAADVVRSLSDFVGENTSACAVCRLPAEVRTEIEQARAADPRRFTYVSISAWLKLRGNPIGEDSIRRHCTRHANV